MSTAPNTLAESAASPSGGDWHRRNVDAVLAEFGSSMDGLADAAIADRRAEFGPNELQESGGTSKLRLIWGQISSVMVLILIGAAVLSLVLGKYLEAGAIGAIVVLFTALGFYQEYRAEQAIAALRRMAVPSARVTRDGRLTSVSASELVPGDIVHLDAGTDRPRRPPADRGGQPAHRGGGAHRRVRAGRQADRGGRSGRPRPRVTGCCMAYSGTQVIGRARRRHRRGHRHADRARPHRHACCRTSNPSDTPLQVRLDRVGKQLAVLGVLVALAVVVDGRDRRRVRDRSRPRPRSAWPSRSSPRACPRS